MPFSVPKNTTPSLALHQRSSSSEKLIHVSSSETWSTEKKNNPISGLLKKYLVFAPLLPTTVISSLLLSASIHQWSVPKILYDVIIANRGSVQLIVQIIANGLGLLHVTVMCMLINYSTRLRLSSLPTSLNALQFWNSLLSRQLNWELPAHFLAILLIFLGVSTIPGAIWAAAITPISAVEFKLGTVALPSYSNTTLLQQNWTDRYLPSVVNHKGVFSYSVGEGNIGPLLYSAARATTIDGSVRDHLKMDHSRFNYHGRSYGIAASVGLSDDSLLLNPLATRYIFQETGYAPMVTCIYNHSSAFSLGIDDVDPKSNLLYVASGYLPNSGSRFEWSRYPGFSTNATVAIGVATVQNAVGRIIGIAAGNFYPNLNNTQCTIDFQPAMFNVTVDIVNRNITVTPCNTTTPVRDIEPTGFLTFLSTWQFTLLATDQTTLYSSLVGNSFNASIASYITSMSNTRATPPDANEATLAGLTNSITAMVDDILVSYASAQIMIANETESVPSLVMLKSLRIGEGQYIVTMVIINAILFLVVVEEAIRTRGWEMLTKFDYMNPKDLLIGSSRGGTELADAVDTVGSEQEGTIVDGKGRASRGIGNVYIVQDGARIIVSSQK